MTYLTFHLVFILPPILALALTQPRPLAGVGGWRARLAIPIICVIAFTYTTPWDNYLVYRGVWWYGADRVLATIGYVPIEEYLFFILQTVLTGLFLYHVLAHMNPPSASTGGAASSRAVRWWGALIYLAVTLAGAALLISGWERGLYMGLILAWAGPVLAALWLYGGDVFWRRRRAFALAVAVPTAYLWVADRTAIALRIWDISDQYSLGVDPAGLPVEEATFFLVTNLLVVQGVMLFLQGDPFSEPAGAHGAARHRSAAEPQRAT